MLSLNFKYLDLYYAESQNTSQYSRTSEQKFIWIDPKHKIKTGFSIKFVNI